jgi:transposase-like protein
MGKSTSHKHTAEFKAKVVTEALSEQSTLSELSSKYELSQAQISRWKAEFVKNATAAFGGSTKRTEKEILAERDRHLLKIEELEMKLDYAKRASNTLGIPMPADD